VLDEQRQVRGILALSDVVRAYRAALRADARRISRASANAVLIEEPVADGSALAGHPLREAALPEATIVLSVQRGDAVYLGLGTAPVAAGDVITMLARPDQVGAVRGLLGSARSDAAPAADRDRDRSSVAGQQNPP
jgi:Trk K+ transport system NAD-binding subunit